MEFYFISKSVLFQFPGYVYVILSVVHGILLVGGGFPPHYHGHGVEEGVDPGGPYPLSSIINNIIIVIVYAVYAVRGGGGGGKEQIVTPPPPLLLLLTPLLLQCLSPG